MTAPDLRTDYDIFDPAYVADPYPVWRELRETCPVAHSDRWGGSWMPLRYDDVVALAHDVETYSSRFVLVAAIPPGAGDGPPDPYADVAAPPITSDPPEHLWARRLILPMFSPRSVARYEAGTRALCHRLIDGFIAGGEADAAADYAQQIPVRVIAAMLGVPDDRSDEFTEWVRGVLEFGLTDGVRREAARNHIIQFFVEQIALRRDDPRDDLLTELIQAEVDGLPVPVFHILGTCHLLLLAGIDTTWSAIGASLWHLAQHPDDAERLRRDPGLWPTAIEELLRAYSPVTMARVATRDTTFQGCPIRQGDRVLMTFPAANRDPAAFERPDDVVLDRAENRHVAFGSGIHRCAGSNLARLELRVALEVFLDRVGPFALSEPAAVTWAGGQVRGPRSVPIRFVPGGPATVGGPGAHDDAQGDAAAVR